MKSRVLPLPDYTVRDSVIPDDSQAKTFYENSTAQARTYEKGIPPCIHVLGHLIVSMNPSSVFEFGCNSGRNLEFIRSRLPQTLLHGVDLNEEAIAFGKQQFGLDLAVGTEGGLRQYPDNTFDVTFTHSVLDHIPFIEATVRELLRVTRSVLIFDEPCGPKTGKVERQKADAGWEDAYPHFFIHGYRTIVHENGGHCLVDAANPRNDQNLGELYRVMAFATGKRVAAPRIIELGVL